MRTTDILMALNGVALIALAIINVNTSILGWIIWVVVAGSEGLLWWSARNLASRRERDAAEQQTKFQNALRAAEIASRTKTEFLSRMSHEIRTPMNALLGMTDLLERTPLNPKQSQYLSIFRSSTERLLRLINDLLDIGKIEAGAVEIVQTEFRIRHVLDQVCELFGHTAASKGLRLAVHVAPEVPDSCLGDADRLQQVLINLTGNAIKFTEVGFVEIRVGMNGADNIAFTIIDTGPGIARQEQERIFESFTQVSSFLTRSHEGTGLGLAISRQLVELMRGRLSVESKPGEGSVFRFTIPVTVHGTRLEKSEEARNIEVQPAQRERPARVLLAEDSLENVFLIQAYLGDCPYILDIVPDGAEALRLVRQHCYDVILMDLQMPQLDGLSATRMIRKWESETRRPPVPILALTAHGWPEHAEQSLAAGCTAHLLKPIHRSTLIRAIEQQLGRVSEHVPEHPKVMPQIAALAPEFLENRRKDVDRISQALTASDFDTIAGLAHRMKGSGSGYGYPMISELGGALEAAARRKDTEKAQSVAEGLRACLIAFQNAEPQDDSQQNGLKTTWA